MGSSGPSMLSDAAWYASWRMSVNVENHHMKVPLFLPVLGGQGAAADIEGDDSSASYNYVYNRLLSSVRNGESLDKTESLFELLTRLSSRGAIKVSQSYHDFFSNDMFELILGAQKELENSAQFETSSSHPDDSYVSAWRYEPTKIMGDFATARFSKGTTTAVEKYLLKVPMAANLASQENQGWSSDSDVNSYIAAGPFSPSVGNTNSITLENLFQNLVNRPSKFLFGNCFFKDSAPLLLGVLELAFLVLVIASCCLCKVRARGASKPSKSKKKGTREGRSKRSNPKFERTESQSQSEPGYNSRAINGGREVVLV